jgi:SAM-dependent methyltransferase
MRATTSPPASAKARPNAPATPTSSRPSTSSRPASTPSWRASATARRELVADALAATLPPPARQFDIADLGCGTGLCGPLLAPWARRLSGCDLSAAMLELAQRRAVYDELEKAELLAYLDAHRRASTSSISADTLCYFGALDGVAPRRAVRLARGGHARLHRRSAGRGRRRDYRLLPHGRYAHARGHLRSVLDGAGLRSSGSTPTCCAPRAGCPCRAGSSAPPRRDDAQAESARISAKRSALPSKPMPGSSGSVTMLSFTATPSGKPP